MRTQAVSQQYSDHVGPLLKPSSSVREIETSDGAALLDMRYGLCLGLNAISMKIWRLLKENRTADQITDILTIQSPDVSRERIYGDIVEFISDLQQKGLLCENEPSGTDHLVKNLVRLIQVYDCFLQAFNKKRVVERSLVFKALFGLVTFDLCRFGNRFDRLHAFIANCPHASRPASTNTIESVCKSINNACTLYPKRVLCLQRSVVTTWLLRRCGVNALMVVGAQKIPFKAHAWTEVDGNPVNERKDVQQIYGVWDRW